MSEEEPPLRLENAEQLGIEPVPALFLALVSIGGLVGTIATREWLLAGAFLPLSWMMFRGARSTARSPGWKGTLEADGGEVRFRYHDRTQLVTRIRGARVFVSRDDRAIVSFDRGLLPQENFLVGTRDEARAFVRKLGLERPDVFRSEAGPLGGGAAPRSVAFFVAYLLFFFGGSFGLRDQRFLPFLLLFFALYPFATRVEVGDDGISLRFLGR